MKKFHDREKIIIGTSSQKNYYWNIRKLQQQMGKCRK